MNLKENVKLVSPVSEKLSYSGRIDFNDPAVPVFIFPGSSVTMSFTGPSLRVLVENNHGYHDNYIGYIIDGVQKKALLSNEGTIQEITLAESLQLGKDHEVILFKRQDGCHEFSFHGFIASMSSIINPPAKKLKRCIEFYGSSAVAGELAEASKDTDIHSAKDIAEYSNAWYSYAMMTARNLKTDISIIAQGGIALLDNAGCFNWPNCIGMESIYDKLHFNPDLGRITSWDFKEYTPQVVVIDIGNYDAVPEDYMRKERDGDKARNWRIHYKDFVLNIRRKYPKAFIVLTNSIAHHHSSWDRAIGRVCQDINDEKIVHFLYSNIVIKTTSSISLAEAEQMAFELSMFLRGLGTEVWKSANVTEV
ncbi:MAG: electron transporter RnfD [Bacillota bacterium]|nr:electron transporter RnfD [Bacillota bacterium]